MARPNYQLFTKIAEKTRIPGIWCIFISWPIDIKTKDKNPEYHRKNILFAPQHFLISINIYSSDQLKTLRLSHLIWWDPKQSKNVFYFCFLFSIRKYVKTLFPHFLRVTLESIHRPKTDFRISCLGKFSLRISVSFEKALFSIISLLTRMKSGGLNYGASRKRGVNRLERLPKFISKIKLEIRFDDHNATLACIPLRDNYRSRLDCTILRSIISSIRKCH